MSSDPSNPSRRQFSRIPFHVQARLRLAQSEHAVEVEDLALKGALVTVPASLSLTLGDSCELLLTLADDAQAIVQRCQVVHQHGQHAGLKALEMDVDSLTNLRRLLELNLGDGALVDRELSQLFATHGAR